MRNYITYLLLSKYVYDIILNIKYIHFNLKYYDLGGLLLKLHKKLLFSILFIVN